MSKEIELAKKLSLLVEFMEDNFKDEDGINKTLLLKTAVAYYEAIVTAEAMRTMIIQSWGKK